MFVFVHVFVLFIWFCICSCVLGPRVFFPLFVSVYVHRFVCCCVCVNRFALFECYLPIVRVILFFMFLSFVWISLRIHLCVRFCGRRFVFLFVCVFFVCLSLSLCVLLFVCMFVLDCK